MDGGGYRGPGGRYSRCLEVGHHMVLSLLLFVPGAQMVTDLVNGQGWPVLLQFSCVRDVRFRRELRA